MSENTLVTIQSAVILELEEYASPKVHEIWIGCLYLPNGNPAPRPKFHYKLRWFESFISYTDRLLEQQIPVVLAGNKVSFQPSEMPTNRSVGWEMPYFFQKVAAFQKLIAQGWTDSLRSLYPTEAIYTYWDYFSNAFARNAGIRIDHFLISPQLAGCLKVAGVDRKGRSWEKTSDHAPNWIELTTETNTTS